MPVFGIVSLRLYSFEAVLHQQCPYLPHFLYCLTHVLISSIAFDNLFKINQICSLYQLFRCQGTTA